MFYVYGNSAGRKALLTITHVSHADRRAVLALHSLDTLRSGDTGGNWKSTICTRVSGSFLETGTRSVELISNEWTRAGVNRSPRRAARTIAGLSDVDISVNRRN
jgi:hypothetical protein